MIFRTQDALTQLDDIILIMSNQRPNPAMTMIEIFEALKSAGCTDIDREGAVGQELSVMLKELLEQLMIDRYVKIVDDLYNQGYIWDEMENYRYQITIKGRLFIGYRVESRLSDAEKLRKNRLETHAEKNAQRLNYLTAFLGIGTFALAIPEIMKIYEQHGLCGFWIYICTLAALSVIVLSLLIFPKEDNQPK